MKWSKPLDYGMVTFWANTVVIPIDFANYLPSLSTIPHEWDIIAMCGTVHCYLYILPGLQLYKLHAKKKLRMPPKSRFLFCSYHILLEVSTCFIVDNDFKVFHGDLTFELTSRIFIPSSAISLWLVFRRKILCDAKPKPVSRKFLSNRSTLP